MEHAGRTRRILSRVFSALGLVIGAGILIYLIFYVRGHVDFAAVRAAAKPLWLLAAVCCVPVFELIDAFIYCDMGRSSGSSVSALGCLDAVAIGEFYYRLGPAGAPVQLGLLISAGYSGPVAATVYTWKAAANTVAYTGYAVAALLSRMFLFRRETASWAVWAVGILAAVYVLLCTGVILVSARPEPVRRWAEQLIAVLEKRFPALWREGRAEKLKSKIAEFCAAMSALKGKRSLLLRTVALMFLELTVLFAIPAFLYQGLGLAGVSMGELLLTQCLVMVLARIVVLPGNAGGAEGSFYLFMAPLFGESLALAMVLWRCAAFLEALLIGGLWSVYRAVRTMRRGRGR